jgi:hypothetical protein
MFPVHVSSGFDVCRLPHWTALIFSNLRRLVLSYLNFCRLFGVAAKDGACEIA